eukprot:gb/GEZN01008489.1/.p1 GENE.gb/GEZN01008489.1/~~gb/GEZN01008489.1/.p1  ORF type:complete len:292 (-),score=29.32 gb/GEZN01008489.1/:275-1150(-)
MEDCGPLEEKGLPNDLLALRLLYSILMLAALLTACFFTNEWGGNLLCVILMCVCVLGIYGAQIGTSSANSKRREVCLTFFCRGLCFWMVTICGVYAFCVAKKVNKVMVESRCNYTNYPKFVASFSDGTCSGGDCGTLCVKTVRRYLIIDGAILLFIACLIIFTLAQYSWTTLARLQRYHNIYLDGNEYRLDEQEVTNPGNAYHQSLVQEDFASKQSLSQVTSRVVIGTRTNRITSPSYIRRGSANNMFDPSGSNQGETRTVESSDVAGAMGAGDGPDVVLRKTKTSKLSGT